MSQYSHSNQITFCFISIVYICEEKKKHCKKKKQLHIPAPKVKLVNCFLLYVGVKRTSKSLWFFFAFFHSFFLFFEAVVS